MYPMFTVISDGRIRFSQLLYSKSERMHKGSVFCLLSVYVYVPFQRVTIPRSFKRKKTREIRYVRNHEIRTPLKIHEISIKYERR